MNNAHYRWDTETLRAMPTLKRIDGEDLKYEEYFDSDYAVRVHYIEDDGNGRPYKNTGAIERRVPTNDGKREWYFSEYYNADNPEQYVPGDFARNYE